MYSGIIKEAKTNMTQGIESFRDDIRKVRAGRATPDMVDAVMVDYYGTLTPLNQVSSVSAPEPRLIVIQAWDEKVVPEIEKGIQKANLGLNPSTDGKTVRLNIPQLTEERRKELVKDIKSMAEESKVRIRNARRDANDGIKKLESNSEISEDERHNGEEEVQKLTDDFIKQIDEIAKDKEDELMQL